DAVSKVGGEIARALERTLGLAHAAGADDGHRPVAAKELRQSCQVMLAPDQRLDARRQPRGKRSRKAQSLSGERGLLPLHQFQRSNVPVAGAMHRLDVLRLIRVIAESPAGECD